MSCIRSFILPYTPKFKVHTMTHPLFLQLLRTLTLQRRSIPTSPQESSYTLPSYVLRCSSDPSNVTENMPYFFKYAPLSNSSHGLCTRHTRVQITADDVQQASARTAPFVWLISWRLTAGLRDSAYWQLSLFRPYVPYPAVVNACRLSKQINATHQ